MAVGLRQGRPRGLSESNDTDLSDAVDGVALFPVVGLLSAAVEVVFSSPKRSVMTTLGFDFGVSSGAAAISTSGVSCDGGVAMESVLCVESIVGRCDGRWEAGAPPNCIACSHCDTRSGNGVR